MANQSQNYTIKVQFGGGRENRASYMDDPNDPFFGEGAWVVNQSKERKEKTDQIGQGLLFNVAKQAAFGVIGRIGSYTGDYIMANQINNMTTVGSLLFAFATGNPVAIATTVFQTSMSMMDYENQRYKANITSQNLSMITGTSATNRSRGKGGKV